MLADYSLMGIGMYLLGEMLAPLRAVDRLIVLSRGGLVPETGAMLFGTTGEFLERLGLPGLDDLPPIAPHLPDASELDAELRALAEDPPVELVETPTSGEETAHE